MGDKAAARTTEIGSPSQSSDNSIEGNDAAFIAHESGEVEGELLADLEGEGMVEDSSDETDDAQPTAGASDEAMIEDDSLQCFEGHSDAVLTVAFHPSRTDLVATGGQDDQAYLWRVGQDAYEATAGSMGTRQLHGHTDSVVALAFNTAGTLLATASLDATMRVWGVEDGALVRVLEGPGGGLEWVCWHPRGDVVLAGSEDFTLWMWLAQSGNCMQVFSGHTGPVTAGAFTPDGKRIVSAGGDGDASLRMWDPKTGECVLTVRGHPFHSEGLTCLSLDHDGQVAATGAVDGSLCVTSIASGRIVATPEAHEDSVEAVGFSGRGAPLAASAGVDGKLLVWDAATFARRGVCEHPGAVTRLAWHPSQPLVASACLDGAVRVWDLRTAGMVRTWGGHRAAVQDVAFSADGSQVLAGSDDHTARVFRL